MARNGMVTTSQPLAAQAGLDILKKGGNAIDAAVATAAVLSVVEPMNVGPAGDLFAIIYIAKENKLYALNASGKAPSGQTLARMNALGYSWDPANWGPGSGMPPGGILTVTVPGSVWGWDEVLRRFGTMTFKETLQPAIDYAEQGFPDLRAHRGRLGAPARPRRPHQAIRADAARRSTPIRSPRGTSDGRAPAAGQIYPQSGSREDVPHPAAAGPRRLLQGRDRPRHRRQVELPLGGTMTLDDLAGYAGEWVDGGDDELSRVRRVHAAAAGADVGDRRDAEHPGGVRAAVGAGPDAGDARAGQPAVLAPRRRGQEAGVSPTSTPTTRIRTSRRCRSIGCCPRPYATVALQSRRSESRIGDRAGIARRQQRRHDRALDGRSLGQHGGVGEQPLLELRLGTHRAGLRHHAAQSRRAVHAGSEEPQRDRAAQAAVQHALGRLRHAATTAR